MPVDMPRIEARSPRELNAHPRVLVVDDEADIRELLDMTLARMGFSCDCARSVAEATRMMRERVYGLCLTDMRMPDADGLDLVRHIAAEYPFLPVAVITAHGSTENAVTALKAGAFDYLSKPVSLAQLRSLVKSALSLPIQSSGATDHSAGLLGSSASIERVRQLIARVARSEVPVYLSGASLPETLDGIERETICEVLTKTHGKRTAAARLLGISFRSLRYRIERLGLHDIPER